MSPKVKVLIVDDHPMIAKGITAYLQEDNRLSLEILAHDGAQDGLFELLRSLSPEVIILDINLPERSGLDLIREIIDLNPDGFILIFSMHLNAEYAKLALSRGAKGYVLKESMPAEIVSAIETVLNDGVYLSPAVAMSLSVPDQSEDTQLLTDREIDVLELISGGKTSKSVARQLNISHRTVETHRRNIHAKLGSRSMAEAVSIVHQKKL